MCSVMNNRSSKIRLTTKGSSSSHHKTTTSSSDTSTAISDNGNTSHKDFDSTKVAEALFSLPNIAFQLFSMKLSYLIHE